MNFFIFILAAICFQNHGKPSPSAIDHPCHIIHHELMSELHDISSFLHCQLNSDPIATDALKNLHDVMRLMNITTGEFTAYSQLHFTTANCDTFSPPAIVH